MCGFLSGRRDEVIPLKSLNKPIWTHLRRGGKTKRERGNHSGSPETNNLLMVKISGVEYVPFLTQVRDNNN